jgi:diguanylate cyclase (GGDEF)-like protein
MDDVVIDVTDPETLLAEVRRLRSEIARLEEKVELLDRLAHQDVLIDMPNRRGFLRQLEAAIDRVSRYDDSAAMLFIDLDGLKMINDTFGHQAGDQALIQVAEVLLEGIRKSDCVARLGGDEFAVLLERADEATAVETAERLVAMITHCEFCFQGMCLPLSVAVGVAVVEPNDTPDTCMARADLAMYREKSVAA